MPWFVDKQSLSCRIWTQYHLFQCLSGFQAVKLLIDITQSFIIWSFKSFNITYVIFIKVREDFKFVRAYRALKWIKGSSLRNACRWKHACDLFTWLFATGCRQNKWKFLWYQNLCFHFRFATINKLSESFLEFQFLCCFLMCCVVFYEARKIWLAFSPRFSLLVARRD